MKGQDFWSRRKAAAEAEARAELEQVQAAKAHEAEAELAAKSDAELLAEAGLPEPEMAQSPEDVRAYLQAALPKRLKDRALRRLWRLNPVLANLDGLVEYGEDYTDAATVVETLQTAYQVGRGMLKTLQEGDLPADAPSDITDEELAFSETVDPGLMAEADADEGNLNSHENQLQKAEIQTIFGDKAEESAMVTAVYRRMRFRFEGP